MTYVVIIIGTILGILQIEKLSFQKLLTRPWLIFILSIFLCAAGVIVESNNRFDTRYTKMLVN